MNWRCPAHVILPLLCRSPKNLRCKSEEATQPRTLARRKNKLQAKTLPREENYKHGFKTGFSPAKPKTESALNGTRNHMLGKLHSRVQTEFNNVTTRGCQARCSSSQLVGECGPGARLCWASQPMAPPSAKHPHHHYRARTSATVCGYKKG